MPKAILTFNLPKEQDDFEAAVKATDMNLILWALDQELRNIMKYGCTTSGRQEKDFTVDSYAEYLREFLRERMVDRGVNFLP